MYRTTGEGLILLCTLWICKNLEALEARGGTQHLKSDFKQELLNEFICLLSIILQFLEIFIHVLLYKKCLLLKMTF